jgi:hypothetical protein
MWSIPHRELILQTHLPRRCHSFATYHTRPRMTSPACRSISPQPWNPNYLNHGVPLEKIPRLRVEKALKTFEVSGIFQGMLRVISGVGSAQAADEPSPPAAASGEVASQQSTPRHPVASAWQVPSGVGLPTPSASIHDAGFFSPFGHQDSNADLFVQSPPSLQAVPEAQQPVAATYRDAASTLELSLYENLPEHHSASSQYLIGSPQGISSPSSIGTRLGKRRRDDEGYDMNLGSLGSHGQLFWPAEEHTPHELNGGDVPGSPSSSRRTKAPRNRKDKAATGTKPRAKLQAANGMSWSQDGLGATTSSTVGTNGPQENAPNDTGPGDPTNGVYLGPARNISHWLQSVYRNGLDGPTCLSSSSDGVGTTRAKGKGKATTEADHFPKIPVYRLKYCLFCGGRSDTMARHLETHRRHGGGDDGWVVTASNEGKFPRGKRLIEAVFLMCFATAKKGYEDPWSEEELAARHHFIEDFSDLDISNEENATVTNASIPEALKGRFVRWCDRLSRVRKCEQCGKKFARADSYRRHLKKCGGLPEHKQGDKQTPFPASATMFAGSSTAVASSSSAPWPEPFLPEPFPEPFPEPSPEPLPEELWAAFLSMSEFTVYEQPLDPAPPSPKRQRRF